MFCSKNFMFRIYLSSCKCLGCRDCVSPLAREGSCSLCKAKNVSFQPLGNRISPAEKNLFRPVSEQPSVAMMLNMMRFRSKHVKRAIEVKSQVSKSNQLRGQRKVDKYKSEEKELKVCEISI